MGKAKGPESHHIEILPIIVAVAVILFAIALFKYPSLVLYEKIEMPEIKEIDWCSPGMTYGNLSVIERIDENYCRISLPDGSEAVVTRAELTP